MSAAISPAEEANQAQRAASDPARSVFVGASAGSGKTKVLTDRLLRLMLAGARPERIQCLTFTKAAAAEMALRLQRILGQWVTMPNDALAHDLRRLDVRPSAATLARARALFAHVLDLPGGMRIGTIHAFSQSLLRRFPLEAAISPHFQLLDDRDAEDARAEAREDMLGTAEQGALQQALVALASVVGLDRFDTMIKALIQGRTRLAAALALGEDLPAAQRRTLGLTQTDQATVMANAVTWPGEETVRRAARTAAEDGSDTVKARALEMLDWLSLAPEARADRWAEWRDLFVRDIPPVPRGDTALVNVKLQRQHPSVLEAFQHEAARIIAVEDTRRAIRLSAVSHAFVTLAAPIVQGYTDRKARAGRLDYDDLIGRTQDLLRDPGAAWVLYKLDGGLDHLLLDEVQDTAPEQWDIALRLTEEFFAGEGTDRDPGAPARSVFAVGDPKQSIYSFQGADIREFNRARARMTGRVKSAGRDWLDVALNVSFRSTAPVLALVDAVFADPQAARGVVEGDAPLSHRANRADHAGTVELWPLPPRPEAPPAEPWAVAERNQTQHSAERILAEAVATWIQRQTDGTQRLDSRDRPLRPGDIMVLVRRRNRFASALVRALKVRGVPVAGLDRMVLTEQPAVKDLLALCEALLLPSDDLTLACVLTSPLGGLDDDDLLALAPHRAGTLWDALRDRAEERPAWRRIVDLFSTLLARVDYATPHALLAEALGPLGGRARLFARLGEEAAEPVAELLNAALTYASLHPPSLQGFLHWLRLSGAEVKREPEAAGDQVRIMTVHGAKGLQAPVVILPDTVGLPPDRRDIVWGIDPRTGTSVPLLQPQKEFRCAALDGLRDRARLDDIEEYNRLLYVALTRAEDRLVVCGWPGAKALADTSWYATVARGFARLPATELPFEGGWEGRLLRLDSPQAAAPNQDQAAAARDAPAPPPAWMGTTPDWQPAPPPAEPSTPQPLAPSRPEGVELGEVPAAASPLEDRTAAPDRFRRGQVMHALLQHLPDLPAAERDAAAARYLRQAGGGIDPVEQDRIRTEARAILEDATLAPLFGPDSRAEVPLTGVIGAHVVGGLVDRLAVLPDRVLLADFKTNRRPPARVADTPVLYQRQMASYRAILRGLFPDRPVIAALIWTRTGQVAVLPDAMLDAAEAALLGDARDQSGPAATGAG